MLRAADPASGYVRGEETDEARWPINPAGRPLTAGRLSTTD